MSQQLLHGTLELLILKILSVGPENGYTIGQRIQDLTQDVLIVEEGSLYPALYRMERRGWIGSKWGRSANNRRAKFYRLTKAGGQRFESEVDSWARFASAITRVIEKA